MADQDSTVLTLVASGAVSTGVLAERVEVPFAGEVVDVTLDVGTAPTDADMVVDVLVNGTSIFGGTLGTVAGNKTAQASAPGWDASSVSLLFKPAADGAVQTGMTIKVDNEEMAVTGVSATSFQDNATGLVSLTVTRGANGTTAATHADGAAVESGLARIPAGQTKSGSEQRGALPNAPQINKGDVITANVTQVGSTVAGSDLIVNVDLLHR